MSVDKSRFQVISILTGTGYTTDESESMLITKRRRKLTQRMMLFSYIFNIIIVSTLVNLFISTSSTNPAEIKLGIILTLINAFLIFIVRKSKKFKRFLDKMVVAIANSKIIKKGTKISVYENYGDQVIAEVELKDMNPAFKNKKLEEIKLREKYNVSVLIIKRNNQTLEQVNQSTILKENDVLVVFGKLKNIRAAFIKKEENNNNNSKKE